MFDKTGSVAAPAATRKNRRRDASRLIMAPAAAEVSVSRILSPPSVVSGFVSVQSCPSKPILSDNGDLSQGLLSASSRARSDAHAASRDDRGAAARAGHRPGICADAVLSGQAGQGA